MDSKILFKGKVAHILTLIIGSLFLNFKFMEKHKVKSLALIIAIFGIFMSNSVYAAEPSLGAITFSSDGEVCVYVSVSPEQYSDLAPYLRGVYARMIIADGYLGIPKFNKFLFATGNFKDYTTYYITSSQTVCWDASDASPGTHKVIVNLKKSMCQNFWLLGIQCTEYDDLTALPADSNAKQISVCSIGWKCKDSTHQGYKNYDCSWSYVTSCSYRCYNDQCNICTPNAQECYGNYIRKCSIDGTSWNDYYQFCPNGCYNGQCNICTPNAQECNGNYIKKCNSDGAGWNNNYQSCPNGCYNGQCKICNPGSMQCDGNNIKTCNSDGTGWTSSACTYGCANNMCKVCAPETKQCNGNNLETCKSDGTGWTSSACTYGCANNMCKVCAPETKQCNGNNLETCKSDGTGWTSSACTYGCANNMCKVCAPETKQCNGNNLETCNTNGIEWITTTCSKGCSGGKCKSILVENITNFSGKICAYVNNSDNLTVEVRMTIVDRYIGSGCDLDWRDGFKEEHPTKNLSSSQEVCWNVSNENIENHSVIVKIWNSSCIVPGWGWGCSFVCKDGDVRSFTNGVEEKAKDIFDAVEMLEYLSGERNLGNLTHSNQKGYYKFVNGNDNKDINIFDVIVLIDDVVIKG